MKSYAKMREFAMTHGYSSDATTESPELPSLSITLATKRPVAKSEASRRFVKNLKTIADLKLRDGVSDNIIASRFGIPVRAFKRLC